MLPRMIKGGGSSTPSIYTDGDTEEYDEEELRTILVAPREQARAGMDMEIRERAVHSRYGHVLRKRAQPASYAGDTRRHKRR